MTIFYCNFFTVKNRFLFYICSVKKYIFDSNEIKIIINFNFKLDLHMSNSTYVLDDKLLASTGTRFLNYILDLVFFVITLIAFGILIGILSSLFGLTSVAQSVQELGDLGWNIIVIIFSIFYYTVMEGLFGRSIAKFITGTVVVDENGEKPSFGTIFKRSLCRLIPFDAFSFLGNSRGWHDSMSDTYVVNKKALEKEVKSFHEFNLIGVQEAN